jgi:hypothetical protein
MGFGAKDYTSDNQSHNQALFIAAGSSNKAMIRLLSGPNYTTYDYKSQFSAQQNAGNWILSESLCTAL